MQAGVLALSSLSVAVFLAVLSTSFGGLIEAWLRIGETLRVGVVSPLVGDWREG